MSATHLWGELPEVVDIKTPRMVLAEQASALQEITNGALTCGLAQSSVGQNIITALRIIAPTLGNYSVIIVRAVHQVIVYPCSIDSPFLGHEAHYDCENEAELIENLTKILQDKKTHKLITDLIQQIKAEEIPF